MDPPARLLVRILVIDDEIAVVSAIRRVLARDYDVTTTTSPSDALAMISGGARFAAILCDVRMPELNGMELHEAIRDIDPAQAGRMIFVSGSAHESGTAAFLARVGNPSLAKPSTSAALRATIAAIVTRA